MCSLRTLWEYFGTYNDPLWVPGSALPENCSDRIYYSKKLFEPLRNSCKNFVILWDTYRNTIHFFKITRNSWNNLRILLKLLITFESNEKSLSNFWSSQHGIHLAISDILIEIRLGRRWKFLRVSYEST